MFNQILLLVVVVLTFFLARKLFDANVAWLSALLTLGCELLWRFSVSGLSTMLLLVIFLGLTWCLLRIEEMAREPQPRTNWLLGLAVAAGVLTGVGALTRYAFGWTIIPVVLFSVFVQRTTAGAARAGGIGRIRAGVDAVGHPQFRSQRHAVWHGGFCGGGGDGFVSAISTGTVGPSRFDACAVVAGRMCHKLAGQCASTFWTNDLPKLGGSWASMLFLGGFAVEFSRDVAVRRMRYFLLMCLGTFIVVQALGQTQLSDESPEVNSENLLVLLAPLVFIYGVEFFLHAAGPDETAGAAIALSPSSRCSWPCRCLPMILIATARRPKPMPVVYPPYYPPDIQQHRRLDEGK